jgi:hypothetical protein
MEHYNAVYSMIRKMYTHRTTTFKNLNLKNKEKRTEEEKKNRRCTLYQNVTLINAMVVSSTLLKAQNTRLLHSLF